MRVTKVMKEYVQEEYNKKYEARCAAIRSELKQRHEHCEKELTALFASMHPLINDILRKYGMDCDEGAAERILNRESSFYYVHDTEAEDANNKECARLRKIREERLKQFFLNCDLGCNKEEFLKMVDELNFD